VKVVKITPVFVLNLALSLNVISIGSVFFKSQVWGEKLINVWIVLIVPNVSWKWYHDGFIYAYQYLQTLLFCTLCNHMCKMNILLRSHVHLPTWIWMSMWSMCMYMEQKSTIKPRRIFQNKTFKW
jgi:hypothetical protein